MATTKAVTVIYNNVTLTASNADTVSSSIDLADGYGASLFVKITNGATGPTVPAQFIIETSADNSNFYQLGGALVANTTNNGVYSWGALEIPMGVKYLRLTAGSNTGQNVTIRAEVCETSAV
jgi:hypothetical protein